jgi:membrane-bound lytic murein transglycosylase A
MVVLAALAALSSCAPGSPERPVLIPIGYDGLPGWSEDRQAQALVALRRTCEVFALRSDTVSVGNSLVSMTARDWRLPCAELPGIAASDDARARSYFEQWFQPFKVSAGSASEGLFTGYFEPLLNGSRNQGGRYTTPLYRRPPELVMVDLGRFRADLARQRIAGVVRDGRLDPFPPRAEIEAGALSGRDLELVWVDDPADAFFLHIQGSGRVRLADGGEMRVGYAGANGHPYTAIGRVLIERGEIEREDVSMQSIRGWLASHPDDARALMSENASYIFFREIEGEGPIGSQGVALAPGRSLAVDPAFVPLGLPVWLDAADPIDTEARIRRLMVAQDTGGAIKGAVRGDVFWGHGDDAARRAGVMKSPGIYFLLIPRAALGSPTG